MRTIKIGKREFPCFVSAETQGEYYRLSAELSKSDNEDDPLNLKLGSRLIYCALRDGTKREWSGLQRWLYPIPKESEIKRLFKMQRMAQLCNKLINDDEENYIEKGSQEEGEEKKH